MATLRHRVSVAILASAVGGLALHGEPARAAAPSDLTPFLDNCRTFVKMNAQVAYRPGREEETRPLLLAAQSTWLLADVLWGTRDHFAFKDGLLTVDSRTESTPPSPPGGSPSVVVGDLFAACRNGFQGTQWIQRRPEDDGYWFKLANVTWYKADLPYPWAEDLHLYVAVHATTRRLTDVVWHIGPSEDWSRVRVDALNWMPATTTAFDRNAPAVDLPRPPTFERIK